MFVSKNKIVPFATRIFGNMQPHHFASCYRPVIHKIYPCEDSDNDLCYWSRQNKMVPYPLRLSTHMQPYHCARRGYHRVTRPNCTKKDSENYVTYWSKKNKFVPFLLKFFAKIQPYHFAKRDYHRVVCPCDDSKKDLNYWSKKHKIVPFPLRLSNYVQPYYIARRGYHRLTRNICPSKDSKNYTSCWSKKNKIPFELRCFVNIQPCRFSRRDYHAITRPICPYYDSNDMSDCSKKNNIVPLALHLPRNIQLYDKAKRGYHAVTRSICNVSKNYRTCLSKKHKMLPYELRRYTIMQPCHFARRAYHPETSVIYPSDDSENNTCPFARLDCHPTYRQMPASDQLKNDLYDIKNKVLVSTGGAEGIGYDITRVYLQKGAKAAILLDNNEEQGCKTLAQFRNKFGKERVDFMHCDVRCDVEEVYSVLKSKYETIDVLLNSAGVINERQPRKCIDTNITGTVLFSLKFFEHMRKDKGGKGGTIINLSSIYGYRVDPFLPVYQCTKFAVLGFTKSLGHEENFKKYGVRVVSINPGLTVTNLSYAAQAWQDQQGLEDQVGKLTWQKVDAVSRCAVEIFENAPSGTAWLIEGNRPICRI